jgi:hypothetical protein
MRQYQVEPLWVVSKGLERRTSRRSSLEMVHWTISFAFGEALLTLQHPTAPFPLAAKPVEGEGVATRCLRSKPELRRMGVIK